MALDFFIGDPSESVPAALSLPGQMHTQLFHRTDELRRLPQLGRMADFCSDARYADFIMAKEGNYPRSK